MKRALVLTSLFVAACSGGGKSPITDDFSGLGDEKSDSFSNRMQIVATLADPSGSVQFDYTPTPLYRAIKLHALAGDFVKITVTGAGKVPRDQPQPDPVTFLVDSRYKIVAQNDDAADGTTASQIVVQLRKSGTFYVIVRDYNYGMYSFDAELVMARASGDLVTDANRWFTFFFTGDEYGSLVERYAVPLDRMPSAAQDDADGPFKSDVGNASGYRLPYAGSVLYFLVGSAEEAYDARPYDADGNPIAAMAQGGDATDIVFGGPGKTP